MTISSEAYAQAIRECLNENAQNFVLNRAREIDATLAKPTTTQANELLPCPFCGDVALPGFDDNNRPRIYCASCGALARHEHWNTRAKPTTSDPSVDAMERVRELVDEWKKEANAVEVFAADIYVSTLRDCADELAAALLPLNAAQGCASGGEAGTAGTIHATGTTKETK